MKSFLKKRWHSLPVGIVTAVLLVCLLAGSAFATYNFLSFTTDVFVDEPLFVEYNLQGEYGGDSDWHELGDLDSETLDRSAGDSFVMDLRVTNRADNPLTVDTVVTGTGVGWFTFTGFPDGTTDNVPNGITRFDDATMDIDGAAPAPFTYTLTFTFTRE